MLESWKHGSLGLRACAGPLAACTCTRGVRGKVHGGASVWRCSGWAQIRNSIKPCTVSAHFEYIETSSWLTMRRFFHITPHASMLLFHKARSFTPTPFTRNSSIRSCFRIASMMKNERSFWSFDGNGKTEIYDG